MVSPADTVNAPKELGAQLGSCCLSLAAADGLARAGNVLAALAQDVRMMRSGALLALSTRATGGP